MFAFSVVIPTYNRPHLLQRALRSVLAQTYQDFEVIVSDDCSPQPASEVVADFEDERLRVVRGLENKGNAGARNAGGQAARGEWIAFLDDDDEMLPHHLEQAAQVLSEAPDTVGFAWSGIEHVRDTQDGHVVLKRELWQPQFSDRRHAYLSFLRSRKIGTNTGFIVRRSAFEQVGYFDERLRSAVDTDFILRLVRAYDFRVIPDVTIRYHDHEGERVRRGRHHQANTYGIILEKHQEALASHPEIHAALLYKLGWLQYHSGLRGEGRATTMRAIQRRPSWYKPWVSLGFFEVFGGFAPSLHGKVSDLLKRMLSRDGHRLEDVQ